MNIIKTIRDRDFGLNIPNPSRYKKRLASRVIVFDNENKVALLYVAKKHYHKLPGGGAEKNESIIETLRRETLEEIGCHIADIKELGIIEEYRNKFALHQVSHCFVAHVVGEKGAPSLEEGEIADGFETIWLGLDDAIQTLEKEAGVDDYEGKFIQMRDVSFLKEVKKSLDNGGNLVVATGQ